MDEDFFQNISNTGNPIEYADTVQRYQTQLPLGISWPTVTGSLNPSDLYTDDTSLYMYYPSGLNKTAVAIQQRDRYGGITFTLISGSTNLYIQASEFFADPNPAFISSPYTVSGEGGTNLISASYLSDTPENPQNYWINLPNPGTYKVVFPNPVISTAFSVTHSGSSPYVFSQMLPRKSVGSYDIDVNSIRAYHVTASFIDAVAIQVSDSIVVGPDLIGAKSIDGSKIIDGTISGVLIRDGSVTGNNIFAGTISGVLIAAETITADNIAVSGITANRLNVSQLDAVAANMGNLVVNSGISVAANGYITVPSGYIEAGKARLDSTGIHIGNVASSNLPSITDTLRIAGSGGSGNIVGMALYNGAFSATVPQALMQLDATNALEIENNAPESALINFNFPTNGLDQGASVQIYNGDLNLRKSPSSPADITSGTIRGWDSDNTLRYELGPDQLLLNNNSSNTFVVNSSDGSITTSGNLYVDGVTTANNNIDVNGSVITEFAVKAKSELNVGFDGSEYAFNVNTAGQITSKVRSTDMGYLTARRTAAVVLLTAGTTITWQAYPRYNNISVAGSDITILNAGYYTFSATFSTQANIASLRMTLQRGTINYVSTLHGAGLSTGGGYMFNFSIGFWSPANTDYRVVLTPSAQTTLVVNNEGFAAPSPIINIYQAIGDIES